MKQPGRPKKTETSEPKRQVLVAISSLKQAQKAAIDADISLSEWIADAIKEKIRG